MFGIKTENTGFYGGALIYALLMGKGTQAAIEFSVTASALKYSIEGGL